MFRLTFLTLAAVLPSSCGSDEKVRAAVASRLSDATEVRFSEMTRSGNLVCGSVTTETFNTRAMPVQFVSDGTKVLFVLRHARNINDEFEAVAAFEPYSRCVQGLGSDYSIEEWTQRAHDRINRRAFPANAKSLRD